MQQTVVHGKVSTIIKVILFSFLVSCFPSTGGEDREILIAVAASVLEPIEELADAFEQSHHISCKVIPGSSGKLTAQIEQGAPFNIFVSADQVYPNSLFERGLTLDSPVVYARGYLALWASDQNLSIRITELTDDKIKSIAIANPKTAPYGRGAEEALKSLGIYELVRDKLVYGESIGQTNQFIFSGAVDAGITSLSAVYSDENKIGKNWMQLPDSSYSPLIQDAVVVRQKPISDQLARKFMDYLRSPVAQAILEKYGYDIPTKTTQ